jgi:hypothetical protein
MADQLTFFYEIYESQLTNNMFPRVSSVWQKPVPSQESEQSCIIRAHVSWFSGFRGEDLNLIFYQNISNLHKWYKSGG